MRISKYIQFASHIASLSLHPRFRVGAVLVSGNRILSVGCNKFRGHPRQINPYTLLPGQSIHAELSTILRSPTTEGTDLFISRILRDNSLALSKPCRSCQIIIEESGIRRVFYTTGCSEVWRQL